MRTLLFGNSNSEDNTLGSAFLRAGMKFTATANGRLEEIEITLNNPSSSALQLGVYDDDSSGPYNLLTYSKVGTAVDGINKLIVPAIRIVSGTSYWLAAAISTGGCLSYSVGAPSSGFYNTSSIPLPDPITAYTLTIYDILIRAYNIQNDGRRLFLGG